MPKEKGPKPLSERVTSILAAGIPLSVGLKVALAENPDHGESVRTAISDFADRHGMNRSSTSSAIHGGRKPTEQMLECLVLELGGTKEQWATMLYEASKPFVATAS